MINKAQHWTKMIEVKIKCGSGSVPIANGEEKNIKPRSCQLLLYAQ